MKKLIKISIVAVVMFMAGTAGARTGDLDVSLEVKGYKGKTVSFVVSNVQNSVGLSLIDGEDRILYSENIEVNGEYRRTYNFDKLPEGEYFLEVEGATKVKRYPVVVDRYTAKLYYNNKSEMFKPIVSVRNNVVYVNLLSLDRSELHVEVYDANDTLLHEDTLKGSYELGKMYDFSNVDGTYTLVLTHKNKTFVEHIKTTKS
ncbi:hypothetical protein [Sinomicrobium weinanense]|uniref:Por secretion system C-terminal sorting domain-containing protein n=1 Tax=Sinomicrobium weinanense TaxID=2842200 RepID=A0A926Q5Z7_9FLAO|nr:hypothetical protein [Sinomicrobium weinanense]MBC9798520.1 hypothetical protein [Sinomicrobium weinanense]MBU3125783.1 hypothetical protein [Sinomicrobium weinanense]